jgi:hypothetical protein
MSVDFHVDVADETTRTVGATSEVVERPAFFSLSLTKKSLRPQLLHRIPFVMIPGRGRRAQSFLCLEFKAIISSYRFMEHCFRIGLRRNGTASPTTEIVFPSSE